MKNLILSLAVLALMAGAAQAYVKVSTLPEPSTTPSTSGSTDLTPAIPGSDGDQISGGSGYQYGGDMDARRQRPARPVPEPGTMALASMGLLALGAAARMRRSRS